MKAIQILALLARRPGEFFDRAAGSLEIRLDPYVRTRPSYPIERYSDVLSKVETLLDADLSSIMAEEGLAEIEAKVQEGLRAMPPDAPFPSAHNGDFRMARLCYALVRGLTPDSVVETGVCYGVTSAFILAALERNGTGMLYSIDLPPLGWEVNDFVGRLVPQDLRIRWRLFRGPSAKLLPRVVAEIGTVDLFLHDSLHTYRSMLRELHTVTPALGARSAVVADDIEGNSAFLDWASQFQPTYWATLAEEAKSSLLGVGVFAGKDHPSAK